MVHLVIQLLQVYLFNRIQYVPVWSYQYSTLSVTTGIQQQGLVLEPFLFIVFIKDLPSNVPSEIEMYIYVKMLPHCICHIGTKKLDNFVEVAHYSALHWFSSNKLLC